MTFEELETLVKQLQRQVELNTLAITQMSNRFSSYATLKGMYSLRTNIEYNSTDIHSLKQSVDALNESVGVVNKLSKLLDTNFNDVAKDDLIQFDGNRWTNVKPSTIGISGNTGATTLEALADVRVTNKTDKQALCWDNATSRWINYTITEGSGGSGGGLDITAMWQELAKESNNTIHPSHIKGNLSIGSLTTSGIVTMANGNTVFNVFSSGVSINGDLVGTGEVTAYKIV